MAETYSYSANETESLDQIVPDQDCVFLSPKDHGEATWPPTYLEVSSNFNILGKLNYTVNYLGVYVGYKVTSPG